MKIRWVRKEGKWVSEEGKSHVYSSINVCESFWRLTLLLLCRWWSCTSTPACFGASFWGGSACLDLQSCTAPSSWSSTGNTAEMKNPKSDNHHVSENDISFMFHPSIWIISTSKAERWSGDQTKNRRSSASSFLSPFLLFFFISFPFLVSFLSPLIPLTSILVSFSSSDSASVVLLLWSLKFPLLLCPFIQLLQTHLLSLSSHLHCCVS